MTDDIQRPPAFPLSCFLLGGFFFTSSRREGASRPESEFPRIRGENRALDPERLAECLKGAFPGVEEPGEAHRVADPARRAYDLRSAARRREDAVHALVEHGDDLGQPLR